MSDTNVMERPDELPQVGDEDTGQAEASEAESRETEETEAEETEESAEGEGEEAEASEEESEDEAEEDDSGETEFEEVEWEGKTYTIPKDLKPHLMTTADYTRKTQELAEQRRALEAEKEQVTKQAETQKELVEDYGRLQAYDAQIAQYEKVDWAKLEQQDPQAAQSHWRTFQQLKDAKNKQSSEIERKEQERAVAAQQDFAKRVEEGRRVLAREIKGWGPEKAAEVAEYGRKQGFTDEELSQVVDPRSIKILHKAKLYDDHLARAKKSARKPSKKADVKPTAKVGRQRAPATSGLSDNLPPEEWVRRRHAQIAKKEGR